MSDVAEGKGTQSMTRLVPLYRYGWAFLLAWVFCVFYLQVVEGYTGGTPAVVDAQSVFTRLLFIGLPVFSSVLTLLLIVRLENRLGSPAQHPVFLWLAPLVTALSSPLLLIQFESFGLTLLMFATGAVLTGVGSGFLWVMWGEYYAKVSQDDVEHITPVSTAAAAVLVLLVSSMSGWVSILVVMCLPLLSGLCFALSWQGVDQQKATAEYSGREEEQAFESTQSHAVSTPWAALSSMGRTGFGILVACLFVCLLGSFWESSSGELLFYQITIAVSILFTIVVAILSAKGPRRISVSFLLRWMCPVLVLGFVAVIIWGPVTGGYAAYTIAIAARFAFCLITQMFFARYASSGRTTAVQAYGLGWAFVHLGDFIGVVALIALEALRAEGLVTVNEIAAVSIALLTILTMFLLSSTRDTVFDSGVGSDAVTGIAASKRAVLDAAVKDIAAFPVVASNGADPADTAAFDDAATEGVAAKETAPRALSGTVAAERAAPAEASQPEPSRLPEGQDASSGRKGPPTLEERIRALSKTYGLTPRETEVFGLLARGRSVPFIRDALVISRDTAATHVKHVYTKLGVHSRQELIDLVHNE